MSNAVNRTFMMNKKILTCIIATLLGGTICAGNRYVSYLTGNDGDGKSWANAKTSISAAIFDVGVGDTMFIAEGPYYESISVQDGATYLGGYNAETGERDVNLYETTIIGSGDDSYLIVKYDAAPENHILIDGITIPYGSMSSFGAPVYLRGNMTLNNCLIRHCSGAQAGAIYLEQGEATVQGVVSNCIIEFCTSTDYAGAIYNDGGIVENCIIRGCQGKYSGIYNRTNGIIQNCVLYNNSGNVASSRGCIYCLGGQVINCTVCNNYGTQYSGIYLSQGQVVNCVFWGNQSEEGFTNPPNYISSSSDSHHNITDNGTSADAFLSITLNIENNAADGPNFVNPTTFVGVHTNVEDSIAMISADFSLTAASTALLSQADASLAPSTDIIGIQRPQGAGVDIGTYEFTGEENPSGCTIASGKCGADADSANVTWVLGCDSVLIISGTGAMMDNNNNSMFNPGGETNPQWAPARTSRNAKMMGVETPWTDYRYAVKIVRIEEGVTHVGDDAFSDCPNITQVSMPESLTSIGSYAFAYASRMHSVTIPTNVTEIEDKAFYNCTNLDTIYCNNPVPATIASTTFTTQSTSVLIVPASSVEQYKAASYWSTFANIQSKDNIPSTDFSVSYIFVGETATLSGNIQLNELGHIAYKDKADNGVASWKINVTRECNVKVTITMEAGSSSGHQFVVDVLDANQEVIAELTQPSKGFGDSSIELPDSIAFITPGVYTIRLSNLTEWSAAIVEGVIFTAITPSSNPCIIASGKCGTVGDSTNVVWELSCDSVLTISGEGSISRKYFSPYIQAIKHVVINEGVTSIPSSVFYNCSTMVSVVIPTTVKTIGLSAFENCYSLTSVTIPDGVTQIDMWAFRSCTSLSSLYISASLSQLNTNRSFDNCVALTSIIVDPENPVYDSRNNCNAIIKTSTNTLVVGCKTTIIPEDVTSIGDWAFCRCKGLSSINIPNSVTSIREYAFDDCTGLTSITIPSSVTEIGSAAFEGCEGLTAIYISDISAWCNIAFSDNPLNIAKHLYLNGELVVNLVIPEDVTTINYHAFNGCADLASIYIPGSVTSMGNEVFSNCPNLGSITISADNTTYDSRNNCNAIIETATNTLVLGCKNSTVPYGVTSIGMRAFSGCNGLNSIELPYGVTSIGESAFLSCYDITTIVLPRTISDIGEDAFFFCSNLDTLVCKATTPPTLGLDAFRAGSNKLHIYVPGQSVAIYQAAERWSSYASKISAMPCMSESGTCGVNGDNLTWVLDCDSVLTIRGEGEMPSSYSGTSAPWYEYGAAIKHINIEEGVTKLALNAFYNSGNNYPNVQTLSIPSTLGAPIENNFFYQCPLKTITINSDTIIGKASYSSGSSLQNKFGAQVEEYIFGGSVRSIANFAFYNQSPDSLRSIILPEGLEAIGNWAFGYIEHLTSVSIPSTVQTIGTDAFAYCSNLRSVELGEGLMTVNGQAFWMCDSLTRVTCNALTPPTLNQTAFDHNQNDTLFIPCEAKESYKQADYWKNFSKIICADDTLQIIASGTFGAQGNNLTWTVDRNYTLTISGSGEMEFFNASEPWAEYRYQLRKIVVEEGVTNLSNVFRLHNQVTEVSLPNTLRVIEAQAFDQCSSITHLELPESVDSIGEGVFYLCESLQEIRIPSRVTMINSSLFRGCRGLRSVEFPNGLTRILTTAFQYCNELNALHLPASLTFIGQEAFADCTGLDTIIVLATTPPEVRQSAFDNVPDTIPVFVPTASLRAYRNHEEWSYFKNIHGIDGDGPQTYTFTLTSAWQFIMLPTVFGLTQDDIVVDGEIEWGVYNSEQRASGRSGWQGFTPQNGFEGSQAYIVRARNGSATLTINIPDQAREQAAVTMAISYHPATREQNANWNFLGNPYPYNYDIMSALEEADIESPVTIWNGTGYDLFTPGIDLKTLDPFEAFFIQLPEGGSEVLPLSSEHIKDTSDSGNNSNSVADENGALPGHFTINTSKQKVQFSRGNLQYQASTATWQFAENQYDVIGEGNVNISATYDGWIDLFGWGTGDNPTKASTSKCDYSSFVDWGINAISNGGNTADMWRTLSANEWTYITGQRTNYESLCGRATVNGIQGFILLPDDWVSPGIPFQGSKNNGYELNQFSLEDWQKMEAAGAVFLPACGGRTGTEMTSTAVQYWSTNEGSSCYAYDIITGGDTAYRLKTNQVERSSAFGVRLVK